MIERIKQAVEVGYDKADKSLLYDLYEEAFNLKICRTCNNDSILAFIKLTRLIEMKKKATQYIFNPESKIKRVVISSRGWVITPDNFTQEQAAHVVNSGAYGDVFIPEPRKAKK